MSRINIYKMVTINQEGLAVTVPSRDYGTNYKPDNGHFEHPSRINEMMQYVLDLHRKSEEHVYMIGFKRTGKCNFVLEIASGNEDEAEIDAMMALSYAKRLKATKIVLVHNHPSGIAQLSDTDIAMTKRFKKYADVAGITLDDHIVMGSNASSYSSYKEMGYFDGKSNVVPIPNIGDKPLKVAQPKRNRYTQDEAQEIIKLIRDYLGYVGTKWDSGKLYTYRDIYKEVIKKYPMGDALFYTKYLPMTLGK